MEELIYLIVKLIVNAFDKAGKGSAQERAREEWQRQQAYEAWQRQQQGLRTSSALEPGQTTSAPAGGAYSHPWGQSPSRVHSA